MHSFISRLARYQTLDTFIQAVFVCCLRNERVFREVAIARGVDRLQTGYLLKKQRKKFLNFVFGPISLRSRVHVYEKVTYYLVSRHILARKLKENLGWNIRPSFLQGDIKVCWAKVWNEETRPCFQNACQICWYLRLLWNEWPCFDTAILMFTLTFRREMYRKFISVSVLVGIAMSDSAIGEPDFLPQIFPEVWKMKAL